jgi:hypothetical protein
MIYQASAIATMETLNPGIFTGSLAPWRAGGLVGNHLCHSSFIPGKSSSSANTTVALTILSSELPASPRIAAMFFEALPSLFLNSPALYCSGCRIMRCCAGHEHQSSGFDCLTIGRRRLGRLRSKYDFSGHLTFLHSQLSASRGLA